MVNADFADDVSIHRELLSASCEAAKARRRRPAPRTGLDRDNEGDTAVRGLRIRIIIGSPRFAHACRKSWGR
jgi:hypothetical protein